MTERSSHTTYAVEFYGPEYFERPDGWVEWVTGLHTKEDARAELKRLQRTSRKRGRIVVVKTVETRRTAKAQ